MSRPCQMCVCPCPTDLLKHLLKQPDQSVDAVDAVNDNDAIVGDGGNFERYASGDKPCCPGQSYGSIL